MKTLLVVPCLAVALVAPASAQDRLQFDVAFNDAMITQSQETLTVGDRIVMNDTLLQGGTEVGSVAGVCTIVDLAGFAICNVTFTLPEGTIATQFVNSPPPEKHFPVLGGTGAYSGASGSGTLIENGDETGSLSFELAGAP